MIYLQALTEHVEFTPKKKKRLLDYNSDPESGFVAEKQSYVK